MITPKDPYASEAETQALLVPDTRTAAERKLAQMMTERGADEQGAEAYPILWKIAVDLLAEQPAPVQEPVGYFSVNDYGLWEENENEHGQPFYTSPPTQQQEPSKQFHDWAVAEHQKQPAQQEPVGKVIASIQHLRSISVELLPEVTVPPVDSMIYTSPPAQQEWIEAACALIKAADDAAADSDYMLDSDDCIKVLRGEWKGHLMNDQPTAPQPAQQEVTVLQPDGLSDAVYTVLEGFTLPHDVRKILETAFYGPTSASPAQRTWVGLTDEEIAQGNKESWVTEQAWQSAVWWAEAKLKEKNNG